MLRGKMPLPAETLVTVACAEFPERCVPRRTVARARTCAFSAHQGAEGYGLLGRCLFNLDLVRPVHHYFSGVPEEPRLGFVHRTDLRCASFWMEAHRHSRSKELSLLLLWS